MGVGEQQGNLRKRLVYSINEIFYSLQGEGRWSGTPMVFVRFSACNLRCPFCDTDFSMGKRMSADEIITEAERIGAGCGRVVFTGGEPSLQLDRKLVKAFHDKGYFIHIETNGTGKLPEGIDWTTLSPKSDWQKGAETKIDKADELKLVYKVRCKILLSSAVFRKKHKRDGRFHSLPSLLETKSTDSQDLGYQINRFICPYSFWPRYGV